MIEVSVVVGRVELGRGKVTYVHLSAETVDDENRSSLLCLLMTRSSEVARGRPPTTSR